MSITEQELDFSELMENGRGTALRPYEQKGYVAKGHRGRKRGRKPGGRNSARIRQRIQDVILRHFIGETNKHIALETGYTQSTVSQILARPYAAKILEELRRDEKNRAVDVHGVMLDQVVENIELPNEIMNDYGVDEHGKPIVPANVKAKVFFELLDRTGFSVVKKIDINSNKVITAIDLRAIKARSAKVEEAQYEEVSEGLSEEG